MKKQKTVFLIICLIALAACIIASAHILRNRFRVSDAGEDQTEEFSYLREEQLTSPTEATIPSEQEPNLSDTTPTTQPQETDTQTEPSGASPVEESKEIISASVPNSEPPAKSETNSAHTSSKPSASSPTVNELPSVPSTSKPSGSTVTNTANTASKYPAATDNRVLMFTRGSQTIFVGESAKINYFYYGNKKLTWFTSHPNLITVDQNGKVTPKFEGNYTLYVTDGQYTAKTEIFAPKDWGMDSGMRFSALESELVVGQSNLLSVSNVSPGSYISYSSSDPTIVATKGAYITAIAPGKAIITAKTQWDYARIAITVVPSTTAVSLDIHKSSLNLYMFDEIKLDYTYTGTSGLTWESSNWNVARISEDGHIFAGAEGSCTIYLTDGTYADECNITVSVAPGVNVTALNFRSTNGPIYDGVVKYKGDYLQFDVAVTPSNASRDTYVTVSDASIIKATRTYNMGEPTFRLDFKKAGTCTVQVHSGDHQVTNSYTIHVRDSYACYPGTEILSPEEYVHCYNQVLQANGMRLDYKPTGYLVLTLSPDELTWENARKGAEGLGHHWWSIGYRHMLITFEGVNEDGNYVFYERGCT